MPVFVMQASGQFSYAFGVVVAPNEDRARILFHEHARGDYDIKADVFHLLDSLETRQEEGVLWIREVEI